MSDSPKDMSVYANRWGFRVREDLASMWPDLDPKELLDLQQSIATIGMVEPITVNEKMEVIEGHQRLRAWIGLGKEEAPVYRVVRTGGDRAKELMLALELNSTDFGTAAAVANAINAKLGAGTAAAQDGRTIDVKAPMDPNSRVDFMARVESVDVALADPPARVIINARTGSIVMNRMVTLEPAAVAHGNLSVTISTTPVVSQPGALSGGQTVVTQQSSIKVKQQGGSLMQVPQTANLSDLVNALNALGANPADLVSILQALKAAGALKADIEVI